MCLVYCLLCCMGGFWSLSLNDTESSFISPNFLLYKFFVPSSGSLLIWFDLSSVKLTITIPKNYRTWYEAGTKQTPVKNCRIGASICGMDEVSINGM